MSDSNVTVLFSDVNTMWTLIGAALVFFMQAGFAAVEAGFTRSKNSGNIIMKNLMDFSIGTPLYWLVGFGIMFGTQTAVFGGLDLFTRGDYTAILPDGVNFAAYFIFQTVFCATAATIVSGAMAERTKFSSYCIYSAVISLIIYPVSGHWIWGGGWLAQLGFHDFAGSTAVHMLGGLCALIGAAMLGARIGKYDKNGKPKAIPGHNIPLGALGVFILWFCWFGFNGGSTVSMTSGGAELASVVFVNTNLAAATATLATMIITWIRYKKPDVSMTLNGSLAGLVAITASCDCVHTWAAAVIGVISAFVVVFGIEFVDKVLKVDDPVGAVGVHFLNGLLGTVLTGVFASNDWLSANSMSRGYFLGIQCLGAVSVIAWGGVTIFITFFIIKKTIGLRVTREEELQGLDLPEHGLVSAYADFQPIFATMSAPVTNALAANTNAPKADIDEAVPVVLKTPKTVTASDVKLTKIEIFVRQECFESLKQDNVYYDYQNIYTFEAVVPIRDMFVSTARTFIEKGDTQSEAYDLRKVIDAAKSVMYTGHTGDGKIFVYDVENVVKVRTGEEGVDALQDEEQY